MALRSYARREFSQHLKAFATIDPNNMNGSDKGWNLVDGKWVGTQSYKDLPDPMTGKPLHKYPDTTVDEIQPFIDSMRAVPKSGLHNPFKNKERYLMLSEVNRKVVEVMHDKEVFDFFVKCIQRTVPKSDAQTRAELNVTVDFYENFCGDRVRFLAHSERQPGDHLGQFNTGYRWPFGAVACITPFNFPIEIPALQFMGALFMGNKPVVKGDTRTNIVLEQWIRMMHYCGLPKEDMDFLYADGPVMEKILLKGNVRNTLFTGSSRVGEHLAKQLHGRIRLEDGGYDWKILGPDVPKQQSMIDYIAWQCDQDAYAHSGQKCSAQSVMFMHKKWNKTDLLEKWKAQTVQRNLNDLTVGPVLTWNNKQIKAHQEAILELDGTKLLWGGAPLPANTIPEIYGSW